MNRSILGTILTLTFSESAALAQNRSLTAGEISSRLEVSGEIYILDASGKKVESASASKSTWRSSNKSPLESHWGNGSKDYGSIHLHHLWTVNADGTISVLIEEFAKENPETKKFEGLLKKSEFVLENFQPVTWRVLNNKERNVIVRLTPSLRDAREVKDLTNLPIAGRDVIISDNKGFLWNDGDRNSFDGMYVGISTHRGTIGLSFLPFKGSTAVGEAWDDEIVLRFDGDFRVKLRSESSFLPAKVGGKVYGIYRPAKKTDHPQSTHIFTSSSEETFQKTLRQ